jgi:hypothetical protein
MTAPPKLRIHTTRLKAKETNGELVIAFRPFIAAHVRLAMRFGTYGDNLGECADRLMCKAIEEECRRGWMPLLMPDGFGGLKRLKHHTPADDAARVRWFATRTTALHADEQKELRQIAARLWFDAQENEDAAEALGIDREASS